MKTRTKLGMKRTPKRYIRREPRGEEMGVSGDWDWEGVWFAGVR